MIDKKPSISRLIKLNEQLNEDIIKYANSYDISISAAIRQLLYIGLKQQKGKN